MLREIDHNLWVAEQPLKYFGLEVGTRMTVIRLANGELMIISPIQIDQITIDQINGIGEVAYIIAPNLYHHLFLANFKTIYPQAKLCAVSGLETKRPDIAINQVLDDEKNLFLGEVDYLLFNGFQTLTPSGADPLHEYVFYHHLTCTLILTDTAFNLDENLGWTIQLAARILGGYQKLRPSLLEKLATKDKNQVKQSVEQVLKWDFERVIMAHGSIVETDGKRQFKEGYEWFLNTAL